MDEGDSDNYLVGRSNRRLLFSSQLSQGIEASQPSHPVVPDMNNDRTLDVRLLSQLDFFTPAVGIIFFIQTVVYTREFIPEY